MAKPVSLIPGRVTIDQLREIDRSGAPVVLTRDAKAAVDRAAALVAEVAASSTPVYGLNTGFGKNANVSIPPAQTAELQRNLILSHASGLGPATPARIVRLMMVLKLISIGRGASGVRWQTIELIEGMLMAGISAVVPVQGSVGASGDLAPLAHMTLSLIGEGEVEVAGHRLAAREALAAAGLSAVVLAAKEGLGMINGTQFSTAWALSALFEAERLADAALVSGALSVDAIMASTTPFHPEIHALRGHPGQINAAARLRALLAGSRIRAWHVDDDNRIQDPYSFRCQPQVMGACLDLIAEARRSLTIEANAVTDNPLVLVESREFPSGGNFHAEPVAFAADQLALALSEIGAIVQRRVALLVDINYSNGLPAFLAGGTPGLNSGFMVPEIAAAALMAENKQRAQPCSIDSTPTSANQEDHVSMAAHGARRLADMTATLSRLIGIETVVAAQGITLRQRGIGWKRHAAQHSTKPDHIVRTRLPKGLATSAALERVMTFVRGRIAPLEQDRPMAADLEIAAGLALSGALCDASGLPPVWQDERATR